MMWDAYRGFVYFAVNGQTQSIPIAKKDMAEIDEWLDFLRTRSG